MHQVHTVLYFFWHFVRQIALVKVENCEISPVKPKSRKSSWRRLPTRIVPYRHNRTRADIHKYTSSSLPVHAPTTYIMTVRFVMKIVLLYLSSKKKLFRAMTFFLSFHSFNLDWTNCVWVCVFDQQFSHARLYSHVRMSKLNVLIFIVRPRWWMRYANRIHLLIFFHGFKRRNTHFHFYVCISSYQMSIPWWFSNIELRQITEESKQTSSTCIAFYSS